MNNTLLSKETGRIGGLRNGERQRAKTHCPKGHPYAGDNLGFGAKGERVCKACKKQSYLRNRSKRQQPKW